MKIGRQQMKRKLVAIVFITAIILGGYFVIVNQNNNSSGGTHIDWVDFVMSNDINYIKLDSEKSLVNESDIGGKIDEVRFTVSNNINNSGYKTKNGDAAFLKEGTELFELKNYNQNFRIVAKVDNKYEIYEAFTNPKAKKGMDLLDISDKVLYISINSEQDGKTQLARIEDKGKVQRLVNMIKEAKVDQNFRDASGDRYFIEFHLMDGSTINRSFWINSGELSKGIILPRAFVDEISNALESVEETYTGKDGRNIMILHQM